MDNITHTFTGLAISYAGFNRKTRFATLAILIGANLPDFDVVAALRGSTTYLKYHRGPTHSIVGITILAIVLWLFFCYLDRKLPLKKTSPLLNAKWLFLGCWVATASHLILDLTNSYGVRVFWPFSNHWYAWDLEFILDPLLLGLIIAALALPALLRLISEEVGARKSSLQRGAIAALCLMAGLWGVRLFAHRRALNMLASRTYQEENPVQVAAFPSPINPFEWTGEAETETAIDVLPVDALGNRIDTENARIYHKPDASPALTAAADTSTARVFLAFARFPWASVNETDKGWDITIRDLRFVSASTERGGFEVRIRLDRQLRPLSQGFSFRAGD
jgi:inner membrane protein